MGRDGSKPAASRPPSTKPRLSKPTLQPTALRNLPVRRWRLITAMPVAKANNNSGGAAGTNTNRPSKTPDVARGNQSSRPSAAGDTLGKAAWANLGNWVSLGSWGSLGRADTDNFWAGGTCSRWDAVLAAVLTLPCWRSFKRSINTAS